MLSYIYIYEIFALHTYKRAQREIKSYEMSRIRKYLYEIRDCYLRFAALLSDCSIICNNLLFDMRYMKHLPINKFYDDCTTIVFSNAISDFR